MVGAGTIGVLAAVAAKAKGAEVTICDVAPDKLCLLYTSYKGMGFIVNFLTDNDKKIEQMSKLAATVIVESLLNLSLIHI